MEEIEIFYNTDVEYFLNNLIFVLYKEEYFNYMENAIEYKDKIIDFIDENIKSFPHKKTPLLISYLGTNYIFYKSNSRTTWYIFFEKNGNQFYISHITNNHSKLAKHFK